MSDILVEYREFDLRGNSSYAVFYDPTGTVNGKRFRSRSTVFLGIRLYKKTKKKDKLK